MSSLHRGGTVAVFTAIGALLGALASGGWHYQPTWAWAGPVPRPLAQRLPAGLIEARGSVGSVKLSELREWSELWPPAAVAGPVAGALLGLGLGALLTALRWRLVHLDTRAPDPAKTPVTLLLGGLGLLIGGLAALGWHVQSTGASWSGGTFLPADLGYPLVGLLLGVTLAGLFHLSTWRLVRR